MSHKFAAVCLLMSCLIASAYSAAKVSFLAKEKPT